MPLPWEGEGQESRRVRCFSVAVEKGGACSWEPGGLPGGGGRNWPEPGAGGGGRQDLSAAGSRAHGGIPGGNVAWTD